MNRRLGEETSREEKRRRGNASAVEPTRPPFTKLRLRGKAIGDISQRDRVCSDRGDSRMREKRERKSFTDFSFLKMTKRQRGEEAVGAKKLPYGPRLSLNQAGGDL
ncbi:hypothetical protein Rs2_45177 [Raphanus sativus]|nr:hypothetical protein Rs2_45177 [Raphanus sativus]